MKYDVIAVGELLADLAETGKNGAGYPVFSANPGGAPANFLAALARCGKQTAFIGKVGCDAFGDRLTATLAEAGIDTAGIVHDPEVFTTLAFVTLDAHGERSFSFARKPGADTMLREEEIPFEMIDQAQVLHFGTLSLTGEPARTATQAAVAHAKAQGKLISFDPNYRAPLWPSEEAAKEQMLWGLAQADVVKLSIEEAQLLWGNDCTEAQAADRLLKSGDGTGASEHADPGNASFVFVTLGGEGAYFASRTERGYVHYTGELHVTDTTGAGDIFGGTALSVILDGMAVDALEHAASFAAANACVAASLSVERPGGISSVPCQKEKDACLGQVRIEMTAGR